VPGATGRLGYHPATLLTKAAMGVEALDVLAAG
jgi:hypothetical protein